MSAKKMQRYALVLHIRGKKLTQQAAAHVLGLSVRQVKLLCRAAHQQSAQGLISQRRGQPSNRRIPQVRRDHFMAMVREH